MLNSEEDKIPILRDQIYLSYLQFKIFYKSLLVR